MGSYLVGMDVGMDVGGCGRLHSPVTLLMTTWHSTRVSLVVKMVKEKGSERINRVTAL